MATSKKQPHEKPQWLVAVAASIIIIISTTRQWTTTLSHYAPNGPRAELSDGHVLFFERGRTDLMNGNASFLEPNSSNRMMIIFS